MPPVRKFNSDYIENVLSNIGKALKKPMKIYLIGGCGMIFRKLKETTKDVDVVLPASGDVRELARILKTLGFTEVLALSDEYKNLGSSSVLKNFDNFQVDLYLRQVCHGLEVSAGMQKRAELFRQFDKLAVYLIAKEDIFLFKSITERELDLDDMRILALSGLDWNVVKNECCSQSTRKVWLSALTIRLEELRKRYGIDTPIFREMKKLAVKKMEEKMGKFHGKSRKPQKGK